MDRRNFLKKSSILVGALLPNTLLAKNNSRKYHFIMPQKPFKFYIKKGKLPGKRVLIIGGIHGNEPGGYKASDILLDTEIDRGVLAILPRSNPESIFTDLRGYNGDMNRKFNHLSKKDSDYYKIDAIKDFIAEFKPDVILSLHDGYGFFAKNHRDWGESIVIDENEYKGINLYQTAKYVSDYLKQKGFNIPIHNTRTFEKNTHHKEQRKSLTYYALESHNIPAFCIEGSKQSTLKRKVQIHLLAIEKFLEIYGMNIKPSFNYLLSNLDKYLIEKPTQVAIYVNNQKTIISNHTILKIPKKEIKFEVLNNRGGGIISKGINVNYKSFFYRHNSLKFEVKNDNKTEYSFIIKA